MAPSGFLRHVVPGLPSSRAVYEIAFSPVSNEAFICGFTGGVNSISI